MEMVTILPVDRISTLPDDILGFILSFFPTKEAVQTSILSKRWRYAWTFASKIEISNYSSNVINPNSTVFTYNVLRGNCVSCLEELELEFTFNYNSMDLRKWMYSASLRKTVKLDLEFPFQKHVMLPTSFFSSKKLEYITLGCGIILNAPKSVHFPSLKSLVLYDVHLFDDESLGNILAGSPVLGILRMTRNRLDTINTLNIQSNSLTCLLLDALAVPFEVSDVTVVIKTPNLIAFHIYDWSPKEFKVDNFPSLLYANICISDGLSSNDNTLAGLLRKLSSAECLILGGNTFEVSLI